MNLRDRMNSSNPVSKPTETGKGSKQNSMNTMLNSNLQPQDLILQKQSETIQKQSQEIEQLTTTVLDMKSQMDLIVPELELLKKQGRPEDIEEIQNLSSENLTLMKKLQEKSATIVSLNGRIGMLSSADLILKENRRLEQSNSELRKKEQSAREEVSAVKKEYGQKQAELQASIDAAHEREEQALTQINEEAARIASLAESKVSGTIASLRKKYDTEASEQKYAHDRKMRQLEIDYKGKTNRLYGMTFGGMLYSFFATFFTAINSPRLSGDIIAACKFVGGFFSGLFENAYLLSLDAWSLNEKIPYKVIDVLIPGLLVILGFLAIPLGVLVLLGFGLYKFGAFYAKFFADSWSVLVALISLILIVWFADYLTFIPWNLIVVFIIIHAVYIIIRMILTSPDRY